MAERAKSAANTLAPPGARNARPANARAGANKPGGASSRAGRTSSAGPGRSKDSNGGHVKPGLNPRKHRTTTALVLIDLVNTWQMDGGERLRRKALAQLPRLANLKQRATQAGAPVIFVNDNFGQWRSDFARVIEHARTMSEEGARIVDALCPGPEDYFVLKPRHSGFFSTPLQLLLQELGVETVVLCGAAGDQCVLATAGDALVRKFKVVIPRDGIICVDAQRTAATLTHFRRSMQIPTPASSEVKWR